MLFNSLEFLIFLPIVFVLYWFVFKKLKAQNLFVLVASYVFYGWWDWRFLFLIAFTSFCSYESGLLIKKYEGNRNKQKWISGGNITINLLILCFFKYFNFFVENFDKLFQTFGVHLDWFTVSVILPVGISFYTFQALSYSIDVYQHRIEPTKDVVAFFTYISFFPQLVAGPIERATNLLPQILKPRVFDYDLAVQGMRQMLLGFFKKIVVADTCALVANQTFSNIDAYNGSALLIGAFCFTFQIYGDFSGYSDIAIGCAKLFGVKLNKNFDVPYLSRDVAEFWRRWHISLNTWFRDYIYIPLGGSRCGKWKTFRNTLIIFLLCGFWHGANWTFVLWGAYHAILFLPLLLLNLNRKNKDVVASDRKFVSFTELLQIVLTFVLVMLGWVIFRADSVTTAFHYLKQMFSMSLLSRPNLHNTLITIESFVAIIILIMIDFVNRKDPSCSRLRIHSQVLRWVLYVGATTLCFLFYRVGQSFIYFQF